MLSPQIIHEIKEAGNAALELHRLDTNHGEMSDPIVIQKWMDDMIDKQDKIAGVVTKWSFAKYELAFNSVHKVFSDPEETKIIRTEWENTRQNIGDILRRALRNWFKRK